MNHTCTKHAPGRACYHHGCRCRDCTDAATRYAKRMKAGHVQRVPADLVRTHVLRLRDSGMTVTAIANAASVATATITRISRGDHPSVRQDVARRILTVRPRPVADVRQGKVDGCHDPTHRLARHRLRRPRRGSPPGAGRRTRVGGRHRPRRLQDPRPPLPGRAQPRRHRPHQLGHGRTGGHPHRRHALPGPQPCRTPRRDARRHPLESVGRDARGHRRPTPTPRLLGER